jgi:hypothetical protein
MEELQKKSYVIYSQINSKGVAKNRNNALKHRVKGSICLLCDDDVVYFEDAFVKILQSFEKNKNIDFLTFKIKTFSGKDYKNYKQEPFYQTLRSLTSIGIIDVAFREEVLEKYNLSFDERFGPGGYYSIGEDFIFMTDAYKQGATILYEPLNIVQHDDVGTGAILKDSIIFGRGAMFSRVFGFKMIVINLLFALKKYNFYAHQYSFLKYLSLLYKGSYDYFKGRVDER